MTDKLNNRVNIICQVYGTNIERLRRLKPLNGNDLQAMKEIAKYMRTEEFMNYSQIANLLYRDRTTVREYIQNG